MNMSNIFIAYLDVLDFKQLVQNNTLHDLDSIYSVTLDDVDFC